MEGGRASGDGRSGMAIIAGGALVDGRTDGGGVGIREAVTPGNERIALPDGGGGVGVGMREAVVTVVEGITGAGTVMGATFFALSPSCQHKLPRRPHRQ